MKINGKSIFKISISVIISVFFISILYNIREAYYTKKKVEKEIIEIEAKIKEYDEKKMKLEKNMMDLSQEEKMEKIARDKFNFKKEGEVTYKIVD